MRGWPWLVALTVVVVGLLWAPEAEAYPWMIRHEYTACGTCHTDPSGGGLLTRYGRAQAALLLSSRLGLPAAEEEPGRYKDFAFGMPLPDEIDAQAWVRSAYLANATRGKIVDERLLLMRADVGAHVRAGAFRAAGTLGAATPDSRGLTQEAWVTSNPDGMNLVSREHWLGVALADEAVLLRAGRLALPFGLRNVDHVSWVRSETRTDTNQQQQHGVAVAYTGEKLRGEVMAVLGNYQLGPDAYRDRGYSAYAEYALGTTSAVGVSSAVVHANADLATRRPIFRQAHGLFGRFTVAKPLVLLAEADVIVKSVRLEDPSTDVAAYVKADYEAFQGVHFGVTSELLTDSRSKSVLRGGWLTAWVFLFAHVDARLDLVYRTVAEGPATATALFQLHGWL